MSVKRIRKLSWLDYIFEHEKLKMEQEIELTQIDSQERQAKQDSDTKFASQL